MKNCAVNFLLVGNHHLIHLTALSWSAPGSIGVDPEGCVVAHVAVGGLPIRPALLTPAAAFGIGLIFLYPFLEALDAAVVRPAPRSAAYLELRQPKCRGVDAAPGTLLLVDGPTTIPGNATKRLGWWCW